MHARGIQTEFQRAASKPSGLTVKKNLKTQGWQRFQSHGSRSGSKSAFRRLTIPVRPVSVAHDIIITPYRLRGASALFPATMACSAFLQSLHAYTTEYFLRIRSGWYTNYVPKRTYYYGSSSGPPKPSWITCSAFATQIPSPHIPSVLVGESGSNNSVRSIRTR